MPRLARLLLPAAPLLVVWLLYGHAVGLPFYTDDANHYRFFQTVESIPALWTGQTWSPYYRPLGYTLWFVLIQLQQGYDPASHHFLNLPFYGLAGVLMALLTARLLPWRRDAALVAGSVAGLAFVTFPFHYQAVYQVGSLFHVMLTFGVLLSVVAGMRALRTGSRVDMAACALGAFVACFSHEMGFMVAPLLTGALLIRRRLRLSRRIVEIAAVPVSIAGLYVALWLLLPRVGTEAGLRLTSSVVDNLAVLSQPLAYPLAALVRPLVAGEGSTALVLLLVALWVSVGLALVWWRARAGMGWALAALGWYALGIALPVVMLQPDYVWSSPRLTMLASVGAVLFGAVVVAACGQRRAERALVGVIVAGLLGFNVTFLNDRRAEYALMSSYSWALMREAQRARAPERGALLVNPPDYIEAWHDERAFLVQSQFASFMSPEVSYNDYLEMNSPGTRYVRPVEAVGVGRVMLHTDHLFVVPTPLIDGDGLLARLRQPRPVIMTQFHAGRFYPVWVGSYGDTQPAPPVAQFDGRVTLSIVEAPALAEGRLRLALQWQVDEPLPAKVFIHVLRSGVMVAQGDGYAWGGLYPFSQWQAGEMQIDRREIPLPPGLALEELELRIGLYREADGVRYPLVVLDDALQAVDDALIVWP